MSTGTNFLLALLGGEAWNLFEILDGKLINGRRPDVAIVHLRHRCWRESDWMWPTIKAFAMGHRTIAPIRDPALSLLTAVHSGKYDPMLRLAGFRDLVELDALAGVEFLPVDLPGVRDEALAAILPGKTSDWRPANSLGDYPLKRRYLAGDSSALPSRLWFELRAAEAGLRPLLERVGYRDLLWWS